MVIACDECHNPVVSSQTFGHQTKMMEDVWRCSRAELDVPGFYFFKHAHVFTVPDTPTNPLHRRGTLPLPIVNWVPPASLPGQRFWDFRTWQGHLSEYFKSTWICYVRLKTTKKTEEWGLQDLFVPGPSPHTWLSGLTKAWWRANASHLRPGPDPHLEVKSRMQPSTAWHLKKLWFCCHSKEFRCSHTCESSLNRYKGLSLKLRLNLFHRPAGKMKTKSERTFVSLFTDLFCKKMVKSKILPGRAEVRGKLIP